eukprot:scaffold3388_cov85-Cylindrotheca_fusiformis.AAC.2
MDDLYCVLPRFSRWILRIIPSSWFPRWFHANIELRIAYLNQAIAKEIERIRFSHHPRFLGAGYDTRSIRLLYQEDEEGHKTDQVWEFDLPAIMNAKKSKLNRLYCFETEEVAARKIEFVGIDLKDPLLFQSTLMEMLLAKNIKGINDDDDDDGSSSWTTIVVSEALFLYLQSGVPAHQYVELYLQMMIMMMMIM